MKIKALFISLLACALGAYSQQSMPAAGEGQIVVWRVGSPYIGSTPDTTTPLDLRQQAEKLGSPIRIESFPAKGFAQVFFDAFEAHKEPDVIAFDNMGILEGASTPLGGFTGIGSSSTVRKALVQVTGSLQDLTGGHMHGWQYLIRTSKNYEAAKRLALRAPECDVDWPQASAPVDEAVSLRITKAYLERSATLRTFEDPERLVAEGERRGNLQVEATRVCGYLGNQKLAFVSLISTYESVKTIGQLPVLLILRRTDDQWRLLAASTDPMTTGPAFLEQLQELASKLHLSPAQENNASAAELLSPTDDLAPPAQDRNYEFKWQPSSSDGVVAEMAEFGYQDDARLFLRFRANKPLVDEVPAGMLWFTQSVWQWRVWSITASGSVTLSPSRSFPH